MKRRPTTPTLIRAALALLLLAIGLAGCGGGEETGQVAPPPDYDSALAGAPPQLAALHKQENVLLDEGKEGYEQAVRDLRGYPVVVNVWGSWCGPCRLEFPHFQQASAKLGKRVAFLGVDSEDSPDLASEFLADNPVPYPSYEDPDREIRFSLGARALPATAFYDRDGKLAYLHQGTYVELDDLVADIRKYALAGP